MRPLYVDIHNPVIQHPNTARTAQSITPLSYVVEAGFDMYKPKVTIEARPRLGQWLRGGEGVGWYRLVPSLFCAGFLRRRELRVALHTCQAEE